MTEPADIIRAWQQCPDASNWPATIDTILVADWRGQQIAWPLFEGEAFAIFRTADSTMVTQDDLTDDQAQRLPWITVEVQP